jgi:hypothetical protein
MDDDIEQPPEKMDALEIVVLCLIGVVAVGFVVINFF